MIYKLNINPPILQILPSIRPPQPPPHPQNPSPSPSHLSPRAKNELAISKSKKMSSYIMS